MNVADVTMPRLSDSMEEGTILAWLVADGADVQAGDELVEIETDKATMVYESERSGVLGIVLGEGETVPVGAVIASIGDLGESAAPPPGPAEEEAAPVAAGAGTPPSPRGADGRRIPVTPVARRIALNAGISVETISGSGPGGRVRRRDVEAAIEAGAAEVASPPASQDLDGTRSELVAVASDGSGVASAKGAATLLEPTGIEQRISRRMSESKATVPDFALEMEVECGPLVELREKLRELSDPAPSLNDLVVKAAAIALRRHPRVNGSYRDGRIELYERVNVGVAVASSRGLLVPTVFDADKRGLATIAARVREVADAVRDGSVSASDLGGGTFTISNLGMFGVARFTAVINPPQAAILTVGTVREKLKLEDEQVSAVPVMDLTLCCDHRVLDGAAGSEFLVTLRGLLEEPLAMAL